MIGRNEESSISPNWLLLIATKNDKCQKKMQPRQLLRIPSINAWTTSSITASSRLSITGLREGENADSA